MLSHQKQAPFRCSQSEKVLPSQFNLKRHVKTHQKESVGSVPNSYFEEIESPSGTEVVLQSVFLSSESSAPDLIVTNPFLGESSSLSSPAFEKSNNREPIVTRTGFP